MMQLLATTSVTKWPFHPPTATVTLIQSHSLSLNLSTTPVKSVSFSTRKRRSFICNLPNYQFWPKSKPSHHPPTASCVCVCAPINLQRFDGFPLPRDEKLGEKEPIVRLRSEYPESQLLSSELIYYNASHPSLLASPPPCVKAQPYSQPRVVEDS